MLKINGLPKASLWEKLLYLKFDLFLPPQINLWVALDNHVPPRNCMMKRLITSLYKEIEHETTRVSIKIYRNILLGKES
jgi:hypothetical protein